MEEEVLQNIGLTKTQAKIYLALSDLGSSTVTVIAKRSNLHRINVYDALEQLVKLGLVSFITKERAKYFDVTPPNNLLNLLREKQEQVVSIIPKLQLRLDLRKKKDAEATVLSGIKAFQQLLDGFLVYNDEILIFGIPKNAPQKMKHYIEGFHKRRIEKKIKMKHIYNYQAIDRIKYLNKMAFSEARYLPQEFDSNVSTNICGDTIVFVGWDDPVWIVQIKNKEISSSYKHYFYLLWKNAQTV